MEFKPTITCCKFDYKISKQNNESQLNLDNDWAVYVCSLIEFLDGHFWIRSDPKYTILRNLMNRMMEWGIYSLS